MGWSVYAVSMSPLILLMSLIPGREKGKALTSEDEKRQRRFKGKKKKKVHARVFKALTAIAAAVA